MPRTGRDAVTETLRDRIVNGLHVGLLKEGERLPGTRALAAELGVNDRVVMAALRALADEGFVVLRPRSGAYVAPLHPAGGGGLPDLGAWLVTVLLQARSRGLPPRDLPEYARRCLETRRVRAACIECNADQLHLLCSELVTDHGYDTESVEVEEMVGADPAREPPAALRRADVLITTLYHAADVQAVAQRIGKPWIAVSLRPEVMQSVAQRLHDGPVYYVATDPRFEGKLRRMLGPLGPVENLRVLLVDRDDLDAIPRGAPTFVMSSAREHVAARYGARGGGSSSSGGGSGPGHPIQPPRSLSDETARELLTFLVRANMAALAAGLA